MIDILPHIFGFSGLFFIVLAWQFKTRKSILWMNVIAFLAFSVELYLLGAVVGSIMMLVAALKVSIAVFTQKKWVIVIFMFVPLGFSITQYAQWYDVLTMIAHVTGVLTFFSKETSRVRALAPVGTTLWAIHNIMAGAWGQFLADLFLLTSMAIGWFRHKKSQ